MHESYLSTLRLLLRILPAVFEGGRLALKGGTAINLFVNDFWIFLCKTDRLHQQRLHFKAIHSIIRLSSITYHY